MIENESFINIKLFPSQYFFTNRIKQKVKRGFRVNTKLQSTSISKR